MSPARNIIRLDTVDSTNTYLRNRPDLWTIPFCTVKAERQTAGRGRFGRSWHMTAGEDLAFSTVYRPSAPTAEIACLTLHVGLAVHRALRPICKTLHLLKWPNDIYIGKKKIAGILCETAFSGNDEAVIIGIGINVNGTEFPEEIRETASSLRLETHRRYDTDEILNDILDQLIPILKKFRIPMESVLLEEWIASSSTIGRDVRFDNGGRSSRGTVTAVLADGSLQIRTSENTIISYRGDVLFQEDECASRPDRPLNLHG